MRYHTHFEVVTQRVEWLRMLNPGTALHGIYGGRDPVPQSVAGLFDGHRCLALPEHLRWTAHDLAVMEWFRTVGRDHDFTHAYVVEWDMVFLEPIATAFGTPEPDESLLTGYTLLEDVEAKWSWTNGKFPRFVDEWRRLKELVEDMYGFAGPYHACQGPGAVLSRQFFEVYDSLEIPPRPVLSHDELRLPLLHDIMGLKVRNNGLYPSDWFARSTQDWQRHFNCRRREITPAELAQGAAEGYTVFHPVYQLLTADLLR
jgi:hypothetical protein